MKIRTFPIFRSVFFAIGVVGLRFVFEKGVLKVKKVDFPAGTR